MSDPILLEPGDPFECLGTLHCEENLSQNDGHKAAGLDDSSTYMEELSGHAALAEEGGGALALPGSFVESFLANPFAVSFPGDLPYSSSVFTTMPLDSMSPQHSPSIVPVSYKAGRAVEKLAKSPLPPVPSFSNTKSSPSSISNGKNKPIPVGTPSPPKTPNSPKRYAGGIQFVDMADKKGAQRIRNTMNSRKHRQNKLERIRELERQLAALEAEKEKWQGEHRS